MFSLDRLCEGLHNYAANNSLYWLKRRKQIKQCSETTVADPSDGSKHAGRENQDKPPASDKGTKLASDPAKTSANNKSNASDEDKKKKKSVKENKCTDLTKYNAIGAVRSHLCNLLYRPYYDNRDKTHEKKEKKMVVQKPNGTVEYIAKSQDTLSCIALKFNITPNKLVEINRLFSHTIVTGQKLYVPVMDHDSNRARSLSSDSPASPVSSSDAEYDKLLDADLARNSSKPIQRVLSSASEEEELVTVKFLKMSCRYITDGKGVVGGVMIVTPNSIMFDPHKSDPLVIENGCEEYGLICPMEEVLSIALYSDISHMKIKDALPSDLPKDLCPLYRPGEWEDLSCDQDINPFSRFQAKNKKKRRAHLSETVTPVLDSAEKSHSDEGFTELEPPSSPATDIPKEDEQTSLKGNELPGQGKQAQGSPPMRKTSKVDFIDTEMLGSGNNNAYSDTFAKETTVAEGTGAHQNSLSDALNGKGPLLKSSEEGNQQKNSEAELKSWLLKKIEGPIEDMLPSKEEKSKTPPMFLSIKVGKPMRKTFADKSMAPIQHYARRGKQPEYWFAVPQERVDHLYAFFVQWSPEVYGKDAKEHGFVVVEKEELDMIDNFFSDTVPKSWEIINVNEARRQQSFSSFEDEVVEDLLPVLKDHSVLLEEPHIQKLAQCLPARTQGYPWRLVYSTAVHGTSLKTLYRNMTDLDSPVLLVIKDMDNQVFGALTSHPFKVSDHCYGTGETFFYSFNPDFKIFTWSGQNYYFIKGNIDSLQLGGGRGHFGLWLDSDLYHGSSYPCETFCNETLSKKEDFIVQDIEVWTFQ
ncbi:nuclear receptor coactivator 7-like isoform X7 [Polyodon spathula]|uniref:nuclear receptor coactivator 7-like isoform X7 n=1 Tax=Polyodon spathula TaxID=7913 RepID=UPI001B7EE7D3|nr:nuclear receptor coactivator 7-like isoform X7 [Polyodon spathula]